MTATRRRRRDETQSLGARTIVLGAFAGTTVAVLFAAEFARVWRLGTMPLARGDADHAGRLRSPVRTARIVREGYRVSSTRENVVFNIIASSVTTLAVTRWITWRIRTRGRLGPIRNIATSSGRHIHHFIPGAVVSLTAGGVALAWPDDELDRLLAIPYGIGIALVLAEAALLLELEDVYWSEKGAFSLQAAFSALALLAAVAYAIQMARKGKPSREADWEMAAKAFDDLSVLQADA